VRRSEISGASSGALSASYTRGLEVSSSRVSGCEGYPLIYLEDSDDALFKSSRFEGGTGGNFIEIYAETGSVESVRFVDCDFKDNKVDFFALSPIVPATEACRFADNSFGEDWETRSVAPASDEKGGSDEEAATDDQSTDEAPAGPQWYLHPSGLSFSYPQGWAMQEYKAQSRVGVFAPDGRSLAIFLTAYRIPAAGVGAQADPAKQGKRLFADSAAALAKLLKEGAGISLSLKADGEPRVDDGLLSANFKGVATKGDGEKAEARVRLVVSGDAVDAMVGLAAEASSLGPDGEIDGIFSSIEATQSE
jgi:hypothetical protein